jgi:hypothetical protein
LLGSEETELLERIAQAGGQLLYDPAALVGHRVPFARLRRRWFWSRGYWGSRGVARSLPETKISCYELLRATWHVALMAGRAMRSLLQYGPRSAECFIQAQNLASRLGLWVGMFGRLALRGLPGGRRREPVPGEITADRSGGACSPVGAELYAPADT